jgi:predicted dienelactone hydrolase
MADRRRVIVVAVLCGSVLPGVLRAQAGTDVLPAPTGPYAIGRVSFHWMDNAREELETKAAGDKRELMVHIFYPRAASVTGQPAVYLPTPTRRGKNGAPRR